MNCPVCKGVSLVMSERQGIEIDYCPQCRGVWLDRGELDKIIDRSVVAPPPAPSVAPVARGYEQSHAPHYDNRSHGHSAHSHGGHYKKKREGFLSDIFDFD